MGARVLSGCFATATGGVSHDFRAVLSADGSRFVRYEHSQRSLELWDRRSKQRLATYAGGRHVGRAALNRGGGHIATLTRAASDARNCRLELWQVGEPTARMRPSLRGCDGLVFSPAGNLLAVFGGRKVAVYEARTLRRRLRATFESTVTAVAFSADAKQLAVACTRFGGGIDEILLLDRSTGSITTQLTGHQTIVMALAFLPSGELVSAGFDSDHGPTAHLWRDGRPIALPDSGGAPFFSLAVSPDGATILGGGTLGCAGVIERWSVTAHGEPTPARLARLPSAPSNPTSVAASPEGGWVVLGDEVVTYSASDGVADVMFDKPERSAISLCSSPVLSPPR